MYQDLPERSTNVVFFQNPDISCCNGQLVELIPKHKSLHHWQADYCITYSYGAIGKNIDIISDKNNSYDDESIVKEGVEINEEAENVSKSTKDDDEMIVYIHVVIFTV